jgi:ABC-type nitrate/sulfonate/bicarbonate transport system substrate-binding protein
MIPHLSGVRPEMSLRRAQARRRFLIDSGRLVLAAAGLATGLGRVRVAGAASQVIIGVTETPCVAPAYTAVSQGFFRDEGLDATIVDLTTPGNLGKAIDAGNGLAAGRADAAMNAVWTVGTLGVTRVGSTTAQLTPSGLWPSDHSGVVAQLSCRPVRK